MTLHDREIKLRKKVVKITASAGCARMGRDGMNMASLMRTGDRRLYEAKALGRDRLVTEAGAISPD